MRIIQINLHHSKVSSAELVRRMNCDNFDVALIQEPYIINNVIMGLNSRNYDILYHNGLNKPRACIAIKKNIKRTLLINFCSGDETTIMVSFREKGGNDLDFVLSSVYFPGDSQTSPPSDIVVEIVQYCRAKSKQMIVGADVNAHHINWGSTDTNARGVDLMDFILSNNLEVVNVGNEPTFVTSVRMEVLDITFCTQFIKSKIYKWRVSQEPSFSDHRYIEFSIKSLVQKCETYRNPKSTNLDVFREKLSEKTRNIPHINTKEDLESAALSLSNAISSSYEESCPLKIRTSNSDSPWFTPRLTKLRKFIRKLWNKSRKMYKKNLFGHEVVRKYRLALQMYNKEVKIAKALSWQLKCEEIERVEESARLHKLLSKGPTKNLGAIKKQSGAYTESVNETLQEMLKNHFPEAQSFVDAVEDLSEEILTNSDIADRIVTTKRLKWAINQFKPFKSPGKDGIYPFLLQEGVDIILPTLKCLFKASISSGFIPKAWRGVKVTFIPKPGRASYVEAKSFRPISLMSFILKTIEKLVDRYIRENVLVSNPLHKYQYAYQPGKSTEAALHSLVSKLEKTLDHREVALTVFLDIEGAFDNTSFDTIINSASTHGVHESLTRWMYNMLKTREVSATLFNESLTILTTRGCPQGGCLSCLMWSFVINSLLVELNEMGGVWAQGYADDIVICVTGKFIGTIQDIMQEALKIVERWCVRNGLSVNPSKTTAVAFTKKRLQGCGQSLKLFNEGIAFVKQVKYLGVILDATLTWNAQLEHLKDKATKSFWSCRRMVGSTWGLKPKITHWLYTQVILPRIYYGSIVWWHKCKQEIAQKMLNSLQRMASVAITGAIRTTPGAALNVLLDLTPLHLKIEEVATLTAFRLASFGLWTDCYKISGHTELNKALNKHKRFWNESDRIIPIFEFNHSFQVIIKSRDEVNVNDYLPNDDQLFWFTDGSKSEISTGSGVFCADFDVGLAANVGNEATVFQAEVKAIELCVDECLERGIEGRNIFICSDSQAALKSLKNPKVNSKTVWNCLQKLQSIGNRNEVTLMWVPGHCGIEGNERADELAKQKVNMVETELSLPISNGIIKQQLGKITLNNFKKLWSNTELRQSKEMMPKIDKKRSEILLQMKRQDVRLITHFITGHGKLNYHLHKMGISDTPTCRLCEEEEETAIHLLCKCPALKTRRLFNFGKFLIEPKDITDIKIIPKFLNNLNLNL
jgi:ribonuclease HI